MEPKYVKIPKKYEKVKRSNNRKVIMTQLVKDLKHFKNIKVLEIGCGEWDFSKNILEKQGCEWYGIDVIKTKLANIKGTIDDIPFQDNTFDLVLCNQMLEHIYEYGISWHDAFTEINRVLKVGGIFLANSPFHLHGHPHFLFGRRQKIRRTLRKYFKPVSMFQIYNNCFI